MTTTRKLNMTEREPINARTRIARDREAIRMLGAWIGNDTNALTPWEPVIDKTQKTLERFNKSHPTLYGRKMIAQIVIGGHTQFLAKAQGMLKHIESTLIKTMRNFIWEENKSPRIALEQLYKPVSKGGLNLLNITATNNPTQNIWVKEYLNMSPMRPTWAKVTDLILDAIAPQGPSAQARMNTFLQTWNVPTKGPRAAKLNEDTTRMLRAARDHNVNFAAIRLTTNMKKSLLALFQAGTPHWPINNKAAKCLLQKHDVKTVTDL